MYAITFFLCGVLAAIASAKTAATAPPFEVTQASIQEVTNGNTTFEFNVYDPDPLTNATAKCGYTWATGSNAYPQATYASCGNSSFAWNMDSYEDINCFVLSIEHVFVDPAIGDYPYNEVTNFGKANVSEPDNLWCTSNITGQASCGQRVDVTIKAPVWATIAKRK